MVLDLHSYNHMRDGPEGEPAPAKLNPDIDIGATTLDKHLYGDVLEAIMRRLRETPVNGANPSVEENVRYPDGGNFPEWIYATYGERICTITLEYKKIFMDEWTSTLDIGAAQDLRTGLMMALQDGPAGTGAHRPMSSGAKRTSSSTRRRARPIARWPRSTARSTG